MNEITLKPIGVIHTPFKEPKGAPIQPARSNGTEGTIELYPEYIDGLKDLDGFSHITLIYYFHLSLGYKLEVIPFLDTERRGLFATRAPKRPNPLGLSTVELLNIENNILYIKNVDMVDGTPLLDIKPFVPEFDSHTDIKTGWLKDRAGESEKTKADNRFEG
ncbi:MAG: tRNA (N6-threonylcarbamoyladenosine(37)-N6)-methyltransferase TrmO [bacterium]